LHDRNSNHHQHDDIKPAQPDHGYHGAGIEPQLHHAIFLIDLQFDGIDAALDAELRGGRPHLSGVVKRGVKPIEVHRLYQNGDGAGFIDFAHHTGNENDARLRIFRDDVSAGGGAVELRHLVIHQNHVGPMAGISLDRFQTGRDNFDDLVLTSANELGERCPHAFLVVRDQNPHGPMMAEEAMPAE